MKFLFEIILFVFTIFFCVLFFKFINCLVYFWKLIIFFKSVPEPPNNTLAEDPMFVRSSQEKDLKLHKIWKLPFLPFVRVYHPDTIRPLLKNADICLRKSAYLGASHRFTISNNTLVVSDDQVFVKKQRSILSHFFNRKFIASYHLEVNNATEAMLKKIECKPKKKDRFSVNLLPLLTRLVTEIHLQIFVSFDAKNNARNVDDFLSSELELTKLRHNRNMKWYLYPDFVYYLTPNGIKDFCLVRKIRSLVKVWLEPKKQTQKTIDTYDIMDAAINESGQHVCDTAIHMITTTRNTVSVTTMFLFHLAKFPSYQKIIRSETKDLFNGNEIKADLQEKEFSKLLYTMMFLKEVMRTHPPLNYTERQITEDIEMDGIIFPKGTYFLIDIYGLHHNEALWDNPEEFRPERFASAPKPQSTDGLKLLPFMAYSRDCIAKQFAIEEMVIIVAKLLQRYEIEFDEHFVMSSEKIHHIPENGVRVYFKSIS